MSNFNFRKKIDWNMLRENRCPKCGKNLQWIPDGKFFFCDCNFRISAKRMNEIIQNMVQKGLSHDDEE